MQCDCPYNKRLHTVCNKWTLGPKRQTMHIGNVCTWNSFVSIFTIFPLSVRTMKHANLVRLYTRTAESNFVCDFNICLVILKLLRRPEPHPRNQKPKIPQNPNTSLCTWQSLSLAKVTPWHWFLCKAYSHQARQDIPFLFDPKIHHRIHKSSSFTHCPYDNF